MRKVFGVGANKTGTTTLGRCLQRLGYRHAFWDPDVAFPVARGDLTCAFDVIESFDSFADWPWPLIFRELDEQYPDAKFILTTRPDSRTWAESLAAHLHRERVVHGAEHVVEEIIFGAPTPDGFESQYMTWYEHHNASVREHFAGRPGKLLDVCWETGSGWPELCEFLGHPLVAEPLPHANPRPEREIAVGSRTGAPSHRPRIDGFLRRARARLTRRN